jgi:hypothetical protein
MRLSHAAAAAAAAASADLQRHLRDAHVEKVLRQRTCPKCHSGASTSGNFAQDDTHVHSDGGGQRHMGTLGRSFSADDDVAPNGMVVEMTGLQVRITCCNMTVTWM